MVCGLQGTEFSQNRELIHVNRANRQWPSCYRINSNVKRITASGLSVLKTGMGVFASASQVFIGNPSQPTCRLHSSRIWSSV